MIEVRRDREIHRENGGWFVARWHFSFDRYRDPQQMGVGPLRVFNHDQLAPGAVWPMHPHADIEGITYVWKGSFRHADSLGNDGILQPGGVQVMTLGAGADHSEQNASRTEPMEFLQLWILPDTPGLPPGIQQRQFSKEERAGRLLQVIGEDAVNRGTEDAARDVGVRGGTTRSIRRRSSSRWGRPRSAISCAGGDRRGLGAVAEESGWRLVRAEEGLARPLRHVCPTGH